MILKFIRETAPNYLFQLVSMLIVTFFVFAFVSDLGLSNPLNTLKEFVANSPSFFYNLMVESAYNYLGIVPFMIIPYGIFWVLFRKYFFKYRVQQITKYTSAHITHELIESFLGVPAFALLLMVQLKLTTQGFSKLYENAADHPWYFMPISFVFLLFFEDLWFYWVHRAMHRIPILYKWIHASHHVSVDSTPFTQYSFNFVEALIIPLGGVIPIFIFPTWGPLYFGYLLLGGMANVVAHTGYEFYPRWTLFWKTTSTHHNMHHQYFDGNYGTHLTFWDKICGTEFPDYEARFLEIKERVEQAKEGENG